MNKQHSKPSANSYNNINMGYDSICCFRTKNKLGLTLVWELTSRCNLQCQFCYVPQQSSELNHNEIIKLYDKIPKLAKQKITDIILTGGEPLLRNDLFDIIAFFIQKGHKIDICSNGTLINAEIAKALAKCVKEISISLHGVSNNTYVNMGNHVGTFEKILFGLEYLHNNDVEIHLIFVPNKYNFQEIFDVVKLASKLKVHSLSFLGIMEYFDKPEIYSRFYLSKKESALVRRNILDIRKTSIRPIINTKRIFFNPPLEKCSAGKQILGIDASGDIWPCLFLKDITNKKMKIESSICIHCKYILDCKFGCIGASYLGEKKYFPDKNCREIML